MSLDLINDFPDRLSPMLVKELRQGLRAKTFVAVFLTLQIAMALILFSAGASASSANAGNVISAVIFIFFSIAVLVVQPLRGIGAVSSEIKGNTIDMMVLTRLSASRIVYGKWFAIVSQSALLLSTIIPYLILRYFFGGMNLVGEIVLLVVLFLTSVSLTAITVGLSANSSFVLRALLPIAALPILLYVVLFTMFSGGSHNLIEVFSLENNQTRLGVAAYLAAIAYLGWSMLTLGSSLIAPAAENHSTVRRSVILIAAIAAGIGFVLTEVDPWFLPWLFTIIGLPAIATALSERSFTLQSVREPFLQRGIIGNIGGSFLAPGWPSGVIFTLLLALIFFASRCIAPLADSSRFFSAEADIALVALLGTFLFPAVLLILFRTDEAARFSNYLLVLIASVIFSTVMLAMAEALSKDELLWFFIWNPFTFLPLASEISGSRGEILFAAIAVAAFYSLTLVIIAFATLNPRKKA